MGNNSSKNQKPTAETACDPVTLALSEQTNQETAMSPEEEDPGPLHAREEVERPTTPHTSIANDKQALIFREADSTVDGLGSRSNDSGANTLANSPSTPKFLVRFRSGTKHMYERTHSG